MLQSKQQFVAQPKILKLQFLYFIGMETIHSTENTLTFWNPAWCLHWAGFTLSNLTKLSFWMPLLCGGSLGLGLLQHHAQRMRPYSGESTPSRPIWEVKHQQAQLVLR